MYPAPAMTFHVYPDVSSKFAMGAVLVQYDKVISTFSRKFNDAQLNYTVTDQELLAILEACKHFKQIIHGCDITVHTNYKNLTFNKTQQSNACVERSLILLQEEFRVKLEHIPGEENTAAGGLSRLAFDKNLVINNTIFATQTIDEEDSHMFPLDMCHIRQKQLTDEPLQQKLKETQRLQNTLVGCNLTMLKSSPSKRRFGYLRTFNCGSLIGTMRYWDKLEVHGQSTQLVNHWVSQDSDQKLKIRFDPATLANATRNQTRRPMESFLSSQRYVTRCHGNRYTWIQSDPGQSQSKILSQCTSTKWRSTDSQWSTHPPNGQMQLSYSTAQQNT
jgi:hypothetical protein